jgi:hypothetical protein
MALAWAPQAGAPDYQAVLGQDAALPVQARPGGAAASGSAPDPYGLGRLDSLAAPVPAAAAAYAAEATGAGQDEEEDMGWEDPPEIGPDGRGPWLDGPDAPWGTAPSRAGRRALTAGAWGLGLGLAAAAVKLFLLN